MGYRLPGFRSEIPGTRRHSTPHLAPSNNAPIRRTQEERHAVRPETPIVALTLGDVAGVGPEVAARAWSEPALHAGARPLVVGQAAVLERAAALVGCRARIVRIDDPEQAEPTPDVLPCLDVPVGDLSEIAPGRVDARAGRAAYAFLDAAIDLAMAGRVDAITTLPLNKEALRAAGVPHPGHTEILAERCGAPEHAMMLYVAPPVARGEAGLGVVHATLHVALREALELLDEARVRRAIRLADRALRPLTGGRPPRIGVAGLNPHAGEHGLFGDEEQRYIGPAVLRAREAGLDAHGPIAADALFRRAFDGGFDAVVALYHDQGHVALKTRAFREAVNVTVGLPIMRTSVAHGTAYDIAGRGVADPGNLVEAVRVAARLVAGRRALSAGRS
jgi:4-hydroxythreonine-4-phosphate dehydrogenase